MELSPDTVLRNRYRITRLLGQGGMGAVYLAYDLALDHEVAVKVNRNSSPEAASQFIAEARMLAALRHPNLPRVIDYFLEGQAQYLVMDYIPGEDLKSIVEQIGVLPLDAVLQWSEQLGSALSYLHRQNPPVYHRDIKPANLKLSPENEVILVDFGIAKTGDAGQATAVGAAGYTPGYAPPEQYGTGRTGPYSDQYAMAATLYHLLTGQKPPDAVQRVLGQAALVSLQSLNPAIPPNVALAIERAMAVRPEERFGSIDEFTRALGDPTYLGTAPTVPPLIDSSTATVRNPLPAAGPFVSVPSRKRFSWVWVVGLIFGAGILALGGWALAQGGGLPAFQPPTRTPLPSLTFTAQPSATITVAPTQTTNPPTSTSVPPTATLTATWTLTPTQAPTSTITPVPLGLGKSRSLAFASDRGDGKTLQIWTMKLTLNAQGQAVVGEFTQITNDPGDKQRPAWSPDGNQLLYVAPGGKGPNGEDYGLDIFKLDLNRSGSKSVNLTHRAGDDTEPAWSPDGKWIAFVNNGRSDKVRMVDLMDADGGSLRRLSVDLEEFSPAWSADGQWLLFIVFARENNILYRRSRTDDFVTEEFFDNKAIAGRTGQTAYPAWSPDGSRIAYIKLELQGEGRVMSMDAATRGDKIVQLTSSSLDRQPAWSQDSQWLAYSTRQDGNFEIYLIRSAGQAKPFNLTNSPARDLWPAWQP